MLAGVNGAGKSSVGGELLRRMGKSWFNPDDYARDLRTASGCTATEANGEAWQEGMRRLETAIAEKRSHAFETTLGGNSIPAKLREAAVTHDLLMWFCGLDSPEHHIARVQQRVARGGHAIPDATIRERYIASIAHLITLLPDLTKLQVYDNSRDAIIGQAMPNPRLLLQMERGRIHWPREMQAFREMPDWAKPVVEAALELHG